MWNTDFSRSITFTSSSCNATMPAFAFKVTRFCFLKDSPPPPKFFRILQLESTLNLGCYQHFADIQNPSRFFLAAPSFPLPSLIPALRFSGAWWSRTSSEAACADLRRENMLMSYETKRHKSHLSTKLRDVSRQTSCSYSHMQYLDTETSFQALKTAWQQKVKLSLRHRAVKRVSQT